MVLKALLLLISISSFLIAALFTYKGEETGLIYIKLFLLTSTSFISLTTFFIKSTTFQDILNIRPTKIFIIIIFVTGFIYFLVISFLLNGKYNDYIVSLELDSISYYTQAKLFTAGHINIPSHELREFFTTGYCINDGKFYSKYFPGWPFFLSIGSFLRLQWIINPIFGFLTVVIVYLIGQEIFNRIIGLFASILLLFSPNFYYLSTSYLSEPSGLFFSSVISHK